MGKVGRPRKNSVRNVTSTSTSASGNWKTSPSAKSQPKGESNYELEGSESDSSVDRDNASFAFEDAQDFFDLVGKELEEVKLGHSPRSFVGGEPAQKNVSQHI